MYQGLSVIAMAPVLDEEQKIVHVVERTPREIVDEVLVIDDGSTDRSAEAARERGARVLPSGPHLIPTQRFQDHVSEDEVQVFAEMGGRLRVLGAEREFPRLGEPDAQRLIRGSLLNEADRKETRREGQRRP